MTTFRKSKRIHLDESDQRVLHGLRNHSLKDENDVKAIVRKLMIELGAFDLGSGATGGFGKSGTADQKWLLDGVFFAIEVKWDVVERGSPTVAQTDYLRGVNANGGLGLVIDRTNIIILVNYADEYPLIWLLLKPTAYKFLSVEWCAKEMKSVASTGIREV